MRLEKGVPRGKWHVVMGDLRLGLGAYGRWAFKGGGV